MINPRESFLNSKPDLKKRWQGLMDSSEFQAGAQTALAELTMRLGNAPDMASAASYHWRLEGAKQYLGILMGMAEAPNVKSPVLGRQNLDHNIK